MRHPWLRRAVPLGLTLSLTACLSDDVEFGLPGGLRARREGNTGNEACPIDPAADGSVCPDWTTDIYPLFDENGTYGCALQSCHGRAPGASGLFIPPGDAATAYANMSMFENATRPYVGGADSYILCNLSPDPDVKIGSLMPLVGGPVQGLVSGDDLVALSNWVLCGSPP
ncbi:MAG: hypothetical protein KC731_21595 [Myxococcales bacterium]|nr:hypothetical protein [Myxococcales bacterium]